MIISVFLLAFGFVILIKGADFFVEGASSLARNFKVPAILIGLTIVAFGTSAPELAVSTQSLLKGNGDIVFGNVIGSNILNILLILGVASLFHPLTVKNNTVKKELPITLLLSILFIVLMLDKLFTGLNNSFTRQDGLILLLFFTVFIYYLVSIMRKGEDDSEFEEPTKYGKLKSFLFVCLGLAGIIFGSDFVVNGATSIAQALGVSEKMIALTVIAFGTSLPELVTSVTATRKGEYDIAIGNVVGSNIFNICAVVGIPVSIIGGIEHISFNIVDLGVFLLSVILLFIFALKDKKISRANGLIFLSVFAAYYSYVIFA